jgi:hypothetical protein
MAVALKVGQITVAQARKLDPVFTAAILKDEEYMLDWEVYGASCNDKLKKGVMVLAHFNDYRGSAYFCVCKVTSKKMNFLGDEDVRISNGVYSWKASKVKIL